MVLKYAYVAAMKIHLITIGKPKLAYAQAGFEEYIGRLKHYHDMRVTHIPDKHNDSGHLLEAIGKSFAIALVIEGTQQNSQELAVFLEKKAHESREISFVIGGPDGLPADVITASDYQLSLSKLTLPHDLAMVVLCETLYRASTIGAGQPYHR